MMAVLAASSTCSRLLLLLLLLQPVWQVGKHTMKRLCLVVVEFFVGSVEGQPVEIALDVLLLLRCVIGDREHVDDEALESLADIDPEADGRCFIAQLSLQFEYDLGEERATVAVALSAPIDHLLDPDRRVGVDGADLAAGLPSVDDVVAQRALHLFAVVEVGWSAEGEDFVDESSEGEHVGVEGVCALSESLGSTPFRRQILHVDLLQCSDHRQTEIGDLRLPITNQHVARRDVSVDDEAAVKVLQTSGCIQHVAGHLVDFH
ncbi:hypothetical protein PENTCL1PPCAC_10594, partial [Pristionchus entomophagus]